MKRPATGREFFFGPGPCATRELRAPLAQLSLRTFALRTLYAEASSDTKMEEPASQVKTEPLVLDSPATAGGNDAELQQSQTTAEPENDESSAPAPPKGPTMCGVCKTTASKYKCSRCYLP